MLNSEMNFGFMGIYKLLFSDTSDPADSAIVKNFVEYPAVDKCFMWASKYHNISIILSDLDIEVYRGKENWTDEYNRSLLCELEDGVVRTFDCAIFVEYRSPFFEFINDVISHIVEGGIFMHIKKMGFEKTKIQKEFNFLTANDKYSVYTVSHLQTAFCLLMLGYVLAVACFVTEIVWHRYSSKGRKGTSTALCHRQT
jgi:hypothetical protein